MLERKAEAMATLERVIEEIKALTPDELKQVRQTVEELLRPSQAQMTEDEFERELIAKGVIAPLEKAKDQYDFHSYKPIKVGGKLLSEMIIEERR